MTIFSLLLYLAIAQPPQFPNKELPEPTKDVPVVFPESVEANVGRAVKIDGKSLGPITVSYYPGIRDSADVFSFDKSIIFVAAREGYYWVGASTCVDGKVSLPVWVMVKVGIPPPLPPGPIPPDPKPPVPPVPPPQPAPIPEIGLRVLIVYDPKVLAGAGKDLQSIIFGAAIREYLNTRTPLGADNQTHEWRIWPAGYTDDQLQYAPPLWKAAYKRPRQSPPWIIISNGVTGFEGPLPTTVDATLELIKKYEPRGRP